MTRSMITALALVTLGAAGACQPGDKPGPEYMPDMARGPAYKAFASNEATRTGITMQRPVAGTIARGARPFHYDKGEAEAQRAGRELTNPFHPTPDVLEHGKALFQIYCQVCHGDQGKGDGPIAAKIPPPTSYKAERLLGYAPGRIFHVITTGANKMPSYATQLAPDDRWLIVTYVRAVLQALPEASPGSIPAGPAPALGPIPVPNTPGAGELMTHAAARRSPDAGGSK
jgi:mono/diheme cytochrome c family protein